MPTIKQLPAATLVAAADLLPLSQGGTTKALAIGSLLSSVQTAISVSPASLLGRVSATAGSPEVVNIGTGLTIAAGSVAATGADHIQLPISTSLQNGDEVVVNSAGLARRMPATSLRSLFSAGSGITIDGYGTIVATGGGGGSAGVSTFNSRSGPITLTSADLSGAGGALAASLPQAATGTPLTDGVAAPGSSPLYARQDHVHPSDTTRLGAVNNLSDLVDFSTARSHLGLGSAATLGVGTVAGTVAAGDDARITGALSAATAAATYQTAAQIGTAIAGKLSANTSAVAGPLASGNAGYWFTGTLTGTGTGSATPWTLIGLEDDASTTGSAGEINALYVNHHVASGAGQGSRSAISGYIANGGPTTGTTSEFYSAVTGACYYSYSDGGTLGSERGDVYGVTGIVSLVESASHYHGIIGAEFDVAITGSASALEKIGLQIVTVNGDAIKGSTVDAAICVTGDFSTTAQYDYGLVFGKPGQRWNVSGTLIGTYATSNSRVIVNGVDLSAVNISGSAFKSPGFNVTGIGALYTTSTLSLSGSDAELLLADTDVSVIAGGMHRLKSDGAGSWTWQVNKAGAADFSATIGAFSVSSLGVLTAPTATAGTNTTQVATTAFVADAVQVKGLLVSTGTSYSMQSVDQFVIVRKVVGSPTMISLPSAPSFWAPYVIKDGNGDASTNNIIVTGTTLIDGMASFVLDQGYESVTLVFNGVDWSVI